jgi:hypothetical protein
VKRNVRWTKHPEDGNHTRRGLVSGNEKYSRARLARLLSRGEAVAGLCPRKYKTMGKN